MKKAIMIALVALFALSFAAGYVTMEVLSEWTNMQICRQKDFVVNK